MPKDFLPPVGSVIEISRIHSSEHNWIQGKIGIVVSADISGGRCCVYFYDHNGQGHSGDGVPIPPDGVRHTEPFRDDDGHWYIRRREVTWEYVRKAPPLKWPPDKKKVYTDTNSVVV